MQIDWSIVALAVVASALAFAGGYIKRLIKETKELITAVADAIEDDNIDDLELACIIRQAKDVGLVVKDIVRLILEMRVATPRVK